MQGHQQRNVSPIQVPAAGGSGEAAGQCSAARRRQVSAVQHRLGVPRASNYCVYSQLHQHHLLFPHSSITTFCSALFCSCCRAALLCCVALRCLFTAVAILFLFRFIFYQPRTHSTVSLILCLPCRLRRCHPKSSSLLLLQYQSIHLPSFSYLFPNPASLDGSRCNHYSPIFHLNPNRPVRPLPERSCRRTSLRLSPNRLPPGMSSTSTALSNGTESDPAQP